MARVTLRQVAMLGASPPVDPLAALSDDFESDEADVEDRGWLWHNESVVATQAIAGGELNLDITEGGGAGSFWFDGFEGMLLYKLVTGDADVRARIRVRNTAGDGTPAPDNFRLVVLAAHDPDRATVLNYVHVGMGSTNEAGNSAEWKTTDDSVSTFGNNSSSGLSPLELDFRLVRVGQVFTAYVRFTGAEPLSSDVGWGSAWQVMDRSSNLTPARAAAVPMPDTLQWGIAVYSNQATHDVQGFVDEVRFATP